MTQALSEQMQAMTVRFLGRCLDNGLTTEQTMKAVKAFVDEMNAAPPGAPGPDDDDDLIIVPRTVTPRTHEYGPAQDPTEYWSPEKKRAYLYAVEVFEGFQADAEWGGEIELTARLSPDKWAPIAARIIRRDNFTCTYCGATGDRYKLHCDHIVALASGGTNDDENLTTACEYCNCSKRDKWPWVWNLPTAFMLLDDDLGGPHEHQA